MTLPPLLRLLADGELYSGEDLAREMSVSRAAVWKGVERLRGHGIEVQAVARRGYRLQHPVELLDASRLAQAVGTVRSSQLRKLEILFEVDSTNTRLLGADPPPYGYADVVLSELQHAGRGRRGRPWIAPFGGSLAMSVGWSFRDSARALPSLSLGVGVAISRALVRAGASNVGLKWPNDILFNDRKLGGVLIELNAEASGPAFVVIGVGLNCWLDSAARSRVEATGVRVAALADACADGATPSRNRVAGFIADEILTMVAEFETAGFAPLRAAWEKLDALRGREVQVLLGDVATRGKACGVDEDGALMLEVGDKMRKFVSGEVSLRFGEDLN